MIDATSLTSVSSEPLTLSSALLARLVDNCQYPLIGSVILFGIRGGQLVEGALGQWLSEAQIAQQPLDGENLRCLLGLWDLTTHKIALFPASTVPHQFWQEKQIEQPEARIANCLGVGAYRYIVGAHEPDASGRAFEEGAFRLSRLQPVLAWRYYAKDHGYLVENGTPTLSVVNDHIHSAQSTTQPTGISFSSAGCQVIQGDHTPPNMPTGFYQTYRILAGQSALPSPLEVGQEYCYLLTEITDLSAIAAGHQALCLQQGSRGMMVRLLQEALMRTQDLDEAMIDKGDFNGYTAKALYDFQKREGHLANGIATARTLKKLGIRELY